MTAPSSLWNENSFFWEDRDHSPVALAALQSALPTLEVRDSSGPGGSVYLRVSGLATERSHVEASVSLRKGKLLALFDFSLCITWDAYWKPAELEGGKGGNSGAVPGGIDGQRVASGELNTLNVGPDDVSEDFSVDVKLTHAPSSPTPALAAVVSHAKSLACGALSSHLRATIRAMAAWLLTLDSGQASLDADARRRTEESQRKKSLMSARQVEEAPQGVPVCVSSSPPSLDAVAATSDPPKLSCATTHAKKSSNNYVENRLLTAASRMALNVGSVVPLPVAPHRVEDAGAPPEIVPSTWNTAGWGYEDKDMTAWAHKHLKSKLMSFDVDVPGGHLRIVEVEVEGEASKILSRGNRGVVFDLSFLAKWEGTLLDTSGTSAGTGDGEVVVTDLDQDCFSVSEGEGVLELPLKIRASEDGGEKDAELTNLFILHGSALLRSRLAEFVAELKLQE